MDEVKTEFTNLPSSLSLSESYQNYYETILLSSAVAFESASLSYFF